MNGDMMGDIINLIWCLWLCLKMMYTQFQWIFMFWGTPEIQTHPNGIESQDFRNRQRDICQMASVVSGQMWMFPARFDSSSFTSPLLGFIRYHAGLPTDTASEIPEKLYPIWYHVSMYIPYKHLYNVIYIYIIYIYYTYIYIYNIFSAWSDPPHVCLTPGVLLFSVSSPSGDVLRRGSQQDHVAGGANQVVARGEHRLHWAAGHQHASTAKN